MSLKKGRKVKIGLVLSQVPGYSETFFNNKIKGLQNNGFEVILFVDYYKKGNIDSLCKVIVAADFNGNSIKRLINSFSMIFMALFVHPKRSLKLYQLDKKDGISIKNRFRNLILNQFLLKESLEWLHFGFGIMAYRRENVAEALGAHMAVSFRGSDLYLSPLKHPGCYNLLFKKEVRYHVLSEGMKQTLKTYHISENKIHIITPAIDIDFFTSNNILAKDETRVNIITVARLHWKKGIEYTLEALAIVKNKKIKFTYTIVGEGEEYERLVFGVYQLGLSNEVVFAGKLSPIEVKKKLEEATIYLQYSVQEGFCNAVLEAQSMGLLCIVSDAEGLDENVLDTKTGWVVPKRKPDILAQKIIDVIGLPLIKKQLIRNTASNRVREEFNLELQNLSFFKFYQF